MVNSPSVPAPAPSLKSFEQFVSPGGDFFQQRLAIEDMPTYQDQPDASGFYEIDSKKIRAQMRQEKRWEGQLRQEVGSLITVIKSDKRRVAKFLDFVGGLAQYKEYMYEEHWPLAAKNLIKSEQFLADSKVLGHMVAVCRQELSRAEIDYTPTLTEGEERERAHRMAEGAVGYGRRGWGA